MTDKQPRFCTEYMVDLNATQAAIRAGYAKPNAGKQGYQLLEQTRIVDRIAKLRKEQEERTLVTADDVVRGLDREAKREGEGSSHSARVSAWGHLGKHLGIFGPKGGQGDPNEMTVRVIRCDIVNRPFANKPQS